MREPGAEAMYVFRHVMVREAAYQLQTPAQRALLHELALAAIPAVFGGMGDSVLDLHAADLADHAMAASAARGSVTGNMHKLRELADQEAVWLQRAARHAAANYDLPAAIAFWDRLAALQKLDAHLHALALIEAAAARRRAGIGHEVGRIAKLGFDAAVRAGAHGLQAKALQVQSLSHSDTDSNLEAERLCRQAMPLAVKAGDAALSLSLRGNLAVFVAVQRRYEEAREIYAGLLEQTRSQGIWLEYLVNLANLANLDSQVGDYAGAERQYRVARALARRHGQPPDSANVLDKLGIVCAYQDRPDDARRYMEMARDEARRGGDRRQYGRILGNLSNVATSHDDCLRLLWESREISLELGNPWGLAATCINLAEQLPENDPRVDNLLNEAEKAARTTSAESYLGIIACSRALRGFDRNGQQAARESWLKGLAQVRQARAPADEQSVLNHMREFCAARGIAEFEQATKPG